MPVNHKYRSTHPHVRQRERRKYYHRGSPGLRRPWTAEEDAIILSSTEPDVLLSEELERSITAIHIRRWRLGGGEVQKATPPGNAE